MSTIDLCTGNFALVDAVPVAFQNNRGGSYHSIGPISNFTAAMQGCCGSPVDIFDGRVAPFGCYHYCVFEGSQDEWKQTRECIDDRAKLSRDRLAQQNITGNGYISGGRSPDQVSSAGTSLPRSAKARVWFCLFLGLTTIGSQMLSPQWKRQLLCLHLGSVESIPPIKTRKSSTSTTFFVESRFHTTSQSIAETDTTRVAMLLLDLPPEVFQRVITIHVSTVGVGNAAKAREACKTFLAYINEEIFARQPPGAFAARVPNKLLKRNLALFLEYRMTYSFSSEEQHRFLLGLLRNPAPRDVLLFCVKALCQNWMRVRISIHDKARPLLDITVRQNNLPLAEAIISVQAHNPNAQLSAGLSAPYREAILRKKLAMVRLFPQHSVNPEASIYSTTCDTFARPPTSTCELARPGSKVYAVVKKAVEDKIVSRGENYNKPRYCVWGAKKNRRMFLWLTLSTLPSSETTIFSHGITVI
ncbi:uncharacterized protein M421DRAFT_95726 [Didymella exigua CBS 183.55]|uniref:Uncharacterized protein n=1 Tax=Didymella exigua CBS 183.55 TaxID=1150837 RepID=A0A6A5RBK8_9PLEO|nr:uncharacterized protein M421DRAFT_95726 [Didymella exigua CBS 183.55]KAF1924046.1 hypothetical protein M421DRAFT_95726 [Didymella exigua CBS 183.55]